MIGLATTLALLIQAAGPVDDPNSPIVIEGQGGYCDMADIAYCPSTGSYLSIYTGENVPPVVDNTFDLRSVSIDPVTGAKGTPHNIDSMAMTPSLCWNPATRTFLAAYAVNLGANKFEVRGCRLDAAGVPVGNPFRISPNNNGWTDTRPRIACDGTSWMVVWRGASTILGRSVSVQGVLEGDELFIRGASTGCPAIAFGAGPDYLVAWRYGGSTFSIEGRTVSAGGALGSLETYSTGSTTAHILDAGAPSVVAIPTSGEFLVGWVHQNIPATNDFRGVPMVCRVAENGQALSVPVLADGRTLQWSRRASAGTLALAWNPISNQVLAAWLESGSLRAARLNPYDLSVLEKDIMIAWPGNPITDYTGPRTSIAARDTDSQVIVQWSIWPGFDYSQCQALRYDLGPAPTDVTVSALAQADLVDAAVPIVPGDVTVLTGFTATAKGISYRTHAVSLEVQVQQAGLAFGAAGTLTFSGSAVPSRSTASVKVTGLTRTLGYCWRVRAVESAVVASDWTVFNGNPGGPDLRIRGNSTPAALAARQLVANTDAPIPTGLNAMTEVVRFAIEIDDSDDDDVMAEFEVRPLGVDFNGEPTGAVAWTAAGGVASLELPLDAGPWHWRYRLTDRLRTSTGWSSFGSNPESSPDFIVVALGSSGLSNPCGASAAGGSIWIFSVSLVFIFIFNRRKA